jgi:hypothetical protein
MHMLLFGSTTHDTDTRTQRGAFPIRRHMTKDRAPTGTQSGRPPFSYDAEPCCRVRRLFSSSDEEGSLVSDRPILVCCSRYAEDLSCGVLIQLPKLFSDRRARRRWIDPRKPRRCSTTTTTCHVVGHCHRLLTKSRKRKCLRFINIYKF